MFLAVLAERLTSAPRRVPGCRSDRLKGALVGNIRLNGMEIYAQVETETID